jgi:hypothetical protein
VLPAAAAAILGAGLPLLLVPASKSSPLLLVLAAVATFAAAASLNGVAPTLRRLVHPLAQPAGLLTALALALAAVSITWAHDPKSSLRQLGQFLPVLLAGAVLVVLFPRIAPRKRALVFAVGIAGTAALIAVDLANGLWLRTLTGGRDLSYAYNRGLVTLALLVWPTAALAVAARKLWMVPVMTVAVAAGVFSGDSASAGLALVAGALVFPIAATLPRLTGWLGLGISLGLLAVQPWFGAWLRNALTSGVVERFRDAHAGERIEIWLSFGEAARAALPWGNGFGASLNLQNSPVAGLVPPERVVLLGASHPHNAFLQVWVELGLPGVLLTAAALVLLFRAIAGMRPALQPFALSCTAAALLVALVSHGAWQPWWWAALGACAAGFAAIEAELRRGEPPS